MTNQDQRYQHRWEFRRTGTDLDSSSDDDNSRPNSASETKHMKQKLVSGQNHEENTQQTIIHRPTSYVGGDKEILPGFKDPNRKAEQPGKKREKKARTTSNHELAADAALFDLRGHMESLVEEIKTARWDLLAWMNSKMKSSSKDDVVSSKPSATRKGQRQNTTRSKTPRKNPNTRRKKASNKMTQKDEGGSVGRRFPATNEEVVPSKETENIVIDVIPFDKIEKQKGKKSRLSAKKQKTTEVEVDQQSNTTVAADADNYLTSRTVQPQKQVENSEQNHLEDGNEKDGGNRNTLNAGTSLSSHQLKPEPRLLHQKEVVFAQNGVRNNASNYEQNTSPTSMGNVNGNGFPFAVVPQGSNGGIGMPNIHNQYGLQYLTQGNRISRMYGEIPGPGFLNGNHGFMGSYSGLNQHLKFNAQQGGVMALQCPDIRRGAFNQSNITSQ